jgi:hypothetical protein
VTDGLELIMECCKLEDFKHLPKTSIAEGGQMDSDCSSVMSDSSKSGLGQSSGKKEGEQDGMQALEAWLKGGELGSRDSMLTDLKNSLHRLPAKPYLLKKLIVRLLLRAQMSSQRLNLQSDAITLLQNEIQRFSEQNKESIDLLKSELFSKVFVPLISLMEKDAIRRRLKNE